MKASRRLWIRSVKRVGVVTIWLVVVSSLAGFASTASARSAAVDQQVLDRIASHGEATFWVVLRERADLTAALGIRGKGARGQFVVDRLQSVADRTQSGLRLLLRQLGVDFKSFWIVNTIRVTAGRAVLDAIAGRPEVAQIRADRPHRIPEPLPGTRERAIRTVEWGINRIRADSVWATFGVRGEGIVVANIDTGVQFNHPALVQQYRGNLGEGSFDHNYNWFDPSNVCGNPSVVPCDNVGHGTHTMGTMVGDDGDPGPNQIGVAPHAQWMTAKGCESSLCSNSALLASGQWILAPTDLTGQNPRPDLAPHIVNNSWGFGPGDPFYQSTVDAWVAAGIFPAFSNGNLGPACATSGSPGDFLNTYSAGAFDIENNIALFSSRGPSTFGGETKPNISAPGVNVRSSVPNNSYASFNGTSMASPHMAGTVALMWSFAPGLVGDIAATRGILDDGAVDESDLTCGGTSDDNNVWGEGRLDAFAAINGIGADLAVTKTDSPDPATLGEPLTYTVIVTDEGPADATGIELTDDLDPSTSFVSATPSQGGPCSLIGSQVTCPLGTLAHGASATVTIVVEPNQVGTISDVATVTADQADQDPSDNSATEQTTVENTFGCTIIGTPGDDTLAGTNAGDVICGLGGSDTLSGLNGGDTLIGGSGDDTLLGGRGADSLVAGAGSDGLFGEAGGDVLDAVDGVSGNDSLSGGPGFDSCTADPGDALSGCP
jgi:uncharacterized repeat protein (TIGR01451 family)